MDYPAEQVVEQIRGLGVTHVVWIPDSVLGTWESALQADDAIELVRVCREGEAWVLAAGLLLGGKLPLVMIQNTGLFESGDAMRNVLFDLKLPLLAVIGYRSALVPNTTDTACYFTEPILRGWGLDYEVVCRAEELDVIGRHLRECLEQERAGVVLISEG